jgi:hypothetical protein
MGFFRGLFTPKGRIRGRVARQCTPSRQELRAGLAGCRVDPEGGHSLYDLP